MLYENYEILSKLLYLEGIEHIQIFFNIIFDKLYELLLNTDNMNSNIKRDIFERNINKMINDIIINKNNNNNNNIRENLINQYNIINHNILKLSPKSNRFLIQESYHPLKYIKEYPLLKFFMISKKIDKDYFRDYFKEIQENQKKYPVINTYLEFEIRFGDIYYLNNINKINPFINYMLNKYDLNITRKEAKEKIIKNELNNDNYIINMFNNFKEGWNNLCNINNEINYLCRIKMKLEKINENDIIAKVLNDDGEKGNGMIVAGVYQKFAEYQNDFINKIVANLDDNTL